MTEGAIISLVSLVMGYILGVYQTKNLKKEIGNLSNTLSDKKLVLTALKKYINEGDKPKRPI
jgi:cell division protein FtsL